MSRKEKMMAMVDFKAPTYFVGYGSLMYPQGINCRGMEKYYKGYDLIPVTLTGFKRSLCTVYKDLAFYGVHRDQESEINAVAFEIESLHDYTMLLLDEAAHPSIQPPMYKALDVRDSIKESLPKKDARVMVLEAMKIDEKSGFLPEYYMRQVWYGIQRWDQKFVDKFLETGGVKYDTSGEGYHIKVDNPWAKSGTIPCAKRD